MARVRRRRAILAASIGAVVAFGHATAQAADGAARPVDLPGTVTVPAFRRPPSVYLSAEAKRVVAAARPAEGDMFATIVAGGSVDAMRNGYAAYAAGQNPMRFDPVALAIRDDVIGGIKVLRVTVGAVAKRTAEGLVIVLPGGGFALATPRAALPMALRLASLTGLEMVIVDYRQAPEAVFPAASEDVAAVYRALLKGHPASRIGTAGASAGGLLTAQALAWFQHVGLPTPAAAAVLCASADARWAGDAWFWQKPI